MTKNNSTGAQKNLLGAGRKEKNDLVPPQAPATVSGQQTEQHKRGETVAGTK